jgi:hypothetical protein
MSQYTKNWSLYLRGFRWLWTRKFTTEPELILWREWGITYKPGWSPLKFCLLVYWWDYGLGTLCGYGVVSLSRAWWERSRVRVVTSVPVRAGGVLIGHGPGLYPFARFMTRLLSKVLDPEHSALTGPRLWGSKSIRN